ncbi:MAG: P-loop domain-containing protein [Nitrospinales bacterium]
MKPSIPKKLRQTLSELDGKGYKAYKKLQGTTWSYYPFQLKFEHVQGDSFAFPSRLSISLTIEDSKLQRHWLNTTFRQLALEDFLLRRFHECVDQIKYQSKGSGKSGLITALIPSQKILKRNAVKVDTHTLRFIHFVGLPANGRSILGKECIKLFEEILPRLWKDSLLATSLDEEKLLNHSETLEDYQALQEELIKNNWATFIADGSLLPRASGISDLPLEKSGVTFTAPENFSSSIKLPHSGNIKGMAIPSGISLIVGGGYHGKSTLLRSIQDAVYPHIPGDGREKIATLNSAVKIRAEDCRSACEVDISPFMNDLPMIKDTSSFSTLSASGSTSQAVNIIESIECESKLLLMDEDTCATNFMIRDSRMQALVHSYKEPITPLIDRVEEIYNHFGISLIIVMGGSGDYFESAHQVISMEWFKPQLVTNKAKEIALEKPTGRKKENISPFSKIIERRTNPKHLLFKRGRKDNVIHARGFNSLSIGEYEVDTLHIEQFAESEQLEMCGWILKRLKKLLDGNSKSNIQNLKEILKEINEKGIDSLSEYENGLLTLPRIQEVSAVLNRIRFQGEINGAVRGKE